MDAKGTVYCDECKMQLCESSANNCDEDMHRISARRRHVRVKVQKRVTKKFVRLVFRYSCGDEFTIHSLAFHYDSCPVNRKLSFRTLPKEIRPPIPSPPNMPVPQENSSKSDYDLFNKESKEIYEAHRPVCPYPGCGRKFDTDRIMKHMNGCRKSQDTDMLIIIRSDIAMENAKN
eukprot:TRINITY_DN6239_c0_g1_i1.p1 TRINITY_DN6239_c0_g1~~TRINITY_DN6239_c0_g1_i1.p1  ORF type:complete len:175 (-),score=18.95 TRINITY_DN6239_c0_g1_i1:265-789(-)